MSRNLLVTGASGQLGRRVIELLLEAKAGNIIATTRTPEKLTDFAEQGVIVRYADFNEPNSLSEAFQGADRLLLISTDAMNGGETRSNQHRAAIKAAEASGVKHIIYTSIVEPINFAPDHVITEKALAESSLNWTVLRNNFYMDFLIPNLNQAYQAGALYSTTSNGKTAYVTREDCARVAAVALADTFDGQRILDITGSQALSQKEIAEIASSALEKPLNFVSVELNAVVQGMISAGMPQPMAQGFAFVQTSIANGKFATATDAYTELTGQKPTTLAQFLKANKEKLTSQN